MEALIAVLIEALLAPLFALFGAIASLLGALLSSLFAVVGHLLVAVFGPKNRTSATVPAVSQSGGTTTTGLPRRARKRSRWFRWLTIVVVSLTALLVIILTVINVWFVDDMARYLLRQQQQRTSILITAEHISGNLFTGRFRAEGIAVQRRDHPAGLIDVTIGSVETEIAVWRVLANPREVASLMVAQVRGRFERGVPGIRPEKKPWTFGGVEITVAQDGVTIDTGKRRARRSFRINALAVRDVDMVYVDHTRREPLEVPLTLTVLTAEPLRSDWAVFDVLFRSNAVGSIAGSPLTIATSGDDLGRETQWHIDALPVAVLANQIGGPFTLLSAGTADVHVVDRWQDSEDDRVIVMDWSVVLHDVQATMPESPSSLMKVLGEPAVAFINGQSASIPLSFHVAIDEHRFHGAASAEAAGMWQVVADSVVATLGEKLGIDSEALRAAGASVRETAKDILDRWRQKR